MIRAALYARVSTVEQAEAYGLAAQLRVLREAAASRGYAVEPGAEYVDDGVSGATADRLRLVELLAAVRARAVDVVLVQDVDRLARALGLWAMLRDELSQADVRLEVLAAPGAEGSSGRLLLGFKAVIAEHERDLIRERTMRGRTEKARRGLIVAGVPPYGYRWDPATRGRLLPEPDEAAIVQAVVDWLADGGTLRGVVRALRARGLRPRTAARWTPSTLHGVLRNPVYTGTAYYNRRVRLAMNSRRRRWRDRGEWIPIPVPALVSIEQMARARATLARNRRTATGPAPTEPALLRGLLQCGTCGRRLSPRRVRSHGRVYRYYRCFGTDALDRTPCPVRPAWVNAPQIEAQIWTAVVVLLRDPTVLGPQLDAHRTALAIQDVEVESARTHARRQLGRVETQIMRALDLLADPGMPTPAIRVRLGELEGERAMWAAALTSAEAQVARHTGETGRGAELERERDVILRGLATLPLEGRIRLLRALLDAIIVFPDRLELHGIVPADWTPSAWVGSSAPSAWSEQTAPPAQPSSEPPARFRLTLAREAR